MQYVATIKKKSPMHQLWRKSAPKNSAHKVRFLDTLFTLNKATGVYTASGDLPNIARLMRHPHVNVDILTQPVGEVTPILPPDPVIPEAVVEADAEAPEEAQTSEESPVVEAAIEADSEETVPSSQE